MGSLPLGHQNKPKIRQAEKTRYCTILSRIPKISKFIETESRREVIGVWRKKRMNYSLKSSVDVQGTFLLELEESFVFQLLVVLGSKGPP